MDGVAHESFLAEAQRAQRVQELREYARIKDRNIGDKKIEHKNTLRPRITRNTRIKKYKNKERDV